MTMRLHIDRLVIEPGALPPGGEPAFRARLEALLRPLAAGGPIVRGRPGDPASQVAEQIGRAVVAKRGPR